MAVYKLHKKGRSGRRVAVRAERIEWNVPAIIICVLMAFAIWLYIASFSGRVEEDKTDSAPSTAQSAGIDDSLEAASYEAALV